MTQILRFLALSLLVFNGCAGLSHFEKYRQWRVLSAEGGTTLVLVDRKPQSGDEKIEASGIKSNHVFRVRRDSDFLFFPHLPAASKSLVVFRCGRPLWFDAKRQSSVSELIEFLFRTEDQGFSERNGIAGADEEDLSVAPPWRESLNLLKRHLNAGALPEAIKLVQLLSATSDHLNDPDRPGFPVFYPVLLRILQSTPIDPQLVPRPNALEGPLDEGTYKFLVTLSLWFGDAKLLARTVRRAELPKEFSHATISRMMFVLLAKEEAESALSFVQSESAPLLEWYSWLSPMVEDAGDSQQWSAQLQGDILLSSGLSCFAAIQDKIACREILRTAELDKRKERILMMAASLSSSREVQGPDIGFWLELATYCGFGNEDREVFTELLRLPPIPLVAPREIEPSQQNE